MLKYIFAAVFIALAWAVVLVFHEFVPMWPAIVVTAVIVLGLVAFVVVKMLASKKAAAKLESALDEEAERQQGSMRPDQIAEIKAMSAEFRKAVAALKASKLGRSGRDALGMLPWYVIIGPPGAGKTTALRNSGLKFPYAAKGGVRGVGGTRNCDWWLTNEAIILDTAGRWSTEDDDREEWLAFLDLLHNTRPKKPINGILLAVSLAELQGDEEEIEALARKLRERIDEVVSRLEMVIPVYLLITKCDLIPGFIELFGDLRDKERGQIWGTTLPLVAEQSERQETLVERLDELSKIIELRALQRLGEERSLEARPHIYAFPQQYAALRQNILDLTSHLFTENAFQDAPIMRGVYFTSGTQEGRPIDRIMMKMAEAFGVRPRMAQEAAPTKPKSYFVRDLFTRVVIPDRDVAVRSSKLLKKQRLLQYLMTGLALAAATAFLFLPITSYLENRRLVNDSFDFVETLGHGRTGREGALATRVLEGVGPMAARLERFEEKGPDVSLRFGLYLGDRLMDPLALMVERALVRPLLDSDAEQMTNFLQGRGGDAEQMLTALELHLLLTQPKAAEEPAPENEKPWLKQWVPRAASNAGNRWQRLLGERSTTKGSDSLQSAVSFYARRVLDTPSLPDRRVAIISKLRAVLLGGNTDPLSDLIRDPSLPRDLRMIDIVGGAVTLFREGGDADKGPVIPGAFTNDGWTIIKKRLEMLGDDKANDPDGWVLGEERKRQRVDVPAVQTAYFRRYVDVWKNFFLALVMKEPTSIESARALFKSLILDHPFDTIWRNADHYMVIRDDSLLGKAKAAGEGGLAKKIGALGGLGRQAAQEGQRRLQEGPPGPDSVEKEFAAFLKFGLTKPTGLESYNGMLAELQAALGESGAPDIKAFGTSLRTQRAKLSALLSSYNEHQWEAPMLERMLMPPLRGSEVAVIGATGDSAGRKWCESIVTAWEQQLAGHYPFSRGSSVRDVRVADMEKFLMPKTGTLWQYFGEVLAADIEHPAGTTIFRVKEGAGVAYKPGLLAFLKRAQEITDVLFAKDPTKMSLPYAVRIHPTEGYHKIQYISGGRTLNYINTRERWEDVVWPARGASFMLHNKAGQAERGYSDAEWGLFHLLDDAKVEKGSDTEDFLKASWPTPLGDGQVKADFKPVTLWKLWRGFEIPKQVVNGARGCGGH
ncbi:MAG TPA: type VI secretion system membrane subunit TssM [Polyangia bacterium]|nr:type VI secretion system membrane subunit TssM [Polyangia bacterium]